MRVTNKQMADSLTTNLFREARKLLNAQTVVATGKKINKPSDDPIGMGKILDYRQEIAKIDQYLRNINTGKTEIETIEVTLDAVDEQLHLAKQHALDESVSEQETRFQTADNIANIREQILGLANTRLGAVYIFAGYENADKPFDETNYNYEGDTNNHSIIIGEGVTKSISAHGEEIFGPAASNVMHLLEDLEAELRATPYDPDAVGDFVPQLDAAITRVRNVRSEKSAIFKQLEATEDQLSRFQTNFYNNLSTTEDANMEKAIVELQVQERNYEIALNVGARIIQPSLLDFLR